MNGISSEEVIRSLGDSAAFGSLKKLLKQVEEAEVVDESIPEAQIKRSQRTQALESAKSTLKQFDAQIKQSRRSINIDFIQEETATRGTTAITSTSALVSSTDVRSDFEREFRQAVEESGLNWNDNSSTQLPPAPAVQQDRERREMARIRTLLRAEQIKARRLKKIKSKSYRKLLRKKEMKGMEELIQKLDKQDPEAAEQVRGELERKLSNVRLNRQRQARLKWSKAAERFGGKEMRSEISRQAQAQDDEKRELIRAVKGKAEGESSDDSDSESASGDDVDDVVAQVKKSINKKILKSATDEVEAGDSKGLMGMKFMRDAASKRNNATIAEANEFVAALEESDSDEADQAVEASSSVPEEGASQSDLVASLFASVVETPAAKSATKSKSAIVLEKPADESKAMPGWGDWVGEGIRPRRSNKRKEVSSAPAQKVKPSALIQVAEEATLRAPLMKYQVKDVPYPYQSRAEYEMAHAQPVGSEWMPLTAHADAIQPRISARLGAVVPPVKLSKHLDADKRSKLIDAWDNRKRVKHTKARFL